MFEGLRLRLALRLGYAAKHRGYRPSVTFQSSPLVRIAAGARAFRPALIRGRYSLQMILIISTLLDERKPVERYYNA